MFLLVALLVAAQPAADNSATAFDTATARTNLVMDEGFNCMDEQIKVQMKAHVIDATPQIIVEGALQSCQYLRKRFTDATTSPEAHISADAAQLVADKWFQSLREAYLKHIDNALAEPQLAKMRATLVISEWRKCVVDKANDWSRLPDDANTIGQAAVTACADFRPNLRSAIVYQLRSERLPVSGVDEMVDKLRVEMKDVSTAAVVAERAKQLPKR